MHWIWHFTYWKTYIWGYAIYFFRAALVLLSYLWRFYWIWKKNWKFRKFLSTLHTQFMTFHQPNQKNKNIPKWRSVFLISTQNFSKQKCQMATQHAFVRNPKNPLLCSGFAFPRTIIYYNNKIYVGCHVKVRSERTSTLGTHFSGPRSIFWTARQPEHLSTHRKL